MQVDPSKGVWVEMEGIMEVRSVLDDGTIMYSEDFFKFQRENTRIQEDYCFKDRVSGEQNIFFCLVCNCDLKSIIPLRDHVNGNKHIRKALEKKRQVLGMPAEPQNAPRKKHLKKPKGKEDVKKTLEERLREIDEPVLGLYNITEFWNSNNGRDPPMYSCKQEGCKSAWGNSDDMFNHLKNHKHQRNFLKIAFPKDGRIDSLNKNELIAKAVEYADENNCLLSEERDYDQILKCTDPSEYKNIASRPQNWSEAKEKYGLQKRSHNSNTNLEPLGTRKKQKLCSSDDYVIFDEDEWKERPVEDQAVRLGSFVKDLREGVASCRQSVEDLTSAAPEELAPAEKECREMIRWYKEIGEVTLELEDQQEIIAVIRTSLQELSRLEAELLLVADVEARQAKEIGKLLANLQQEMAGYMSTPDQPAYTNYKERLTSMSQLLKSYKPSQEAFILKKCEINSQLNNLWKLFEERSEIVEDIRTEVIAAGPETSAQAPGLTDSKGSAGTEGLGSNGTESQESIVAGSEGSMGTVGTGPAAGTGKTSAQRRQEERVKYSGIYTAQMSDLITGIAEKMVKSQSISDAVEGLIKKIMPMETQAFQKKGLDWDKFELTEKVRTRVETYVVEYISKKYPK